MGQSVGKTIILIVRIGTSENNNIDHQIVLICQSGKIFMVVCDMSLFCSKGWTETDLFDVVDEGSGVTIGIILIFDMCNKCIDSVVSFTAYCCKIGLTLQWEHNFPKLGTGLIDLLHLVYHVVMSCIPGMVKVIYHYDWSFSGIDN